MSRPYSRSRSNKKNYLAWDRVKSLGVIYHLSFIIYHLSFIIYHLSFIIYHLSFIIYHLSFINKEHCSEYCLTAPEDQYNRVNALHISIGTSFLCFHIFLIFLPLYWHSLYPFLLLTPKSTFTIISLQDLRILIPGVKSHFFLHTGNFEQILWRSFCLNYTDPSFFKQFIEDTSVSQFWPISDAVKSSTKSDVLLVDFGINDGIPWLKWTDRTLYFSVNVKLRIEFIFFFGVHTLVKFWLYVVYLH